MAVVPDEVKLAMMVIINVDSKFSTDAQLESAIISSFTTDGYTETHGNFFEQVGLANRRVNSEVQKMLFGVVDDYGEPLIFRGLT